MAILIQQKPVSVTPGYEDIIYVVSSDNNAETNFKYVADIAVRGVTTRITVFPHPTHGTAYINVGKIVEAALASDIATDTYGFQECPKSNEEFEVSFGEQYGDPVVVYPNLNTSSRYAWNANIDFLPFQSYDGSGYVMEPSSGTPYLTNQPSGIVIRDDENAWLYGITDTSGVIHQAQIVTKDSAGVIIQTVVVSNPFTNSDVRDSRMMRLSTGTRNLNLIPSSGIVSGAQPIITASVDTYEVEWENSAGATISTTQIYTVDNECTRNDLYRFHFLNQKGGFDSFTFYRAAKRGVRIERSNYKKTIGGLTSATTYGYSKSDRSTIPYNTKLTDNIRVTSDWFDDEVSTWLEELITSPEIYLDDATNGLISIVVTNPNYDIKETETEKLFNLTISFNYSYNRFRQRF